MKSFRETMSRMDKMSCGHRMAVAVTIIAIVTIMQCPTFPGDAKNSNVESLEAGGGEAAAPGTEPTEEALGYRLHASWIEDSVAWGESVPVCSQIRDIDLQHLWCGDHRLRYCPPCGGHWRTVESGERGSGSIDLESAHPLMPIVGMLVECPY